ncbi:MAG: hypothetical protein V3S82_04320 [Dehalococcoidia bacterium]
MADVLASVVRFQQFALEFGPFLLAAWLGLAVTTGLIAAARGRGSGLRVPADAAGSGVRRGLLYFLWHPRVEGTAPPKTGGLLLFSLAASVPALAATYLIDMRAVWLRVVVTLIYALVLGRLVATWPTPGQGGPKGPPQQREGETGGGGFSVRVVWGSFSGQMDRAIVRLVVGFGLASVLTIYVPAYVVGPWMGEGAWGGPYLAALLAMPFQLTGGAEVPLASALLVKGASLGVALSVMVAAPGAAFLVARRLYRSMSLRATVSYLVAVWLVAGSLGVAVDGLGWLMGGR